MNSRFFYKSFTLTNIEEPQPPITLPESPQSPVPPDWIINFTSSLFDELF